MRHLIAVCIAAVTVACASPAVELSGSAPSGVIAASPAVELSGSAPSGVIAAATLAPFGSFEMELAPQYTRNAMVRQRAAKALDAGRISLETARAVLMRTDVARAHLDAARSASKAGPTDEARARLAAARTAIDTAEKSLEQPK